MKPKINLTEAEKKKLRSNKFKISDLTTLAVDEIEVILEVSFARAREIHAFAEFQSIPSIGIRFAEDLIFLGYYTLEELKTRDAAELLDGVLTRYVETQIYRAVVENVACEMASKMVAMKAATDNAGKLIEQLQLKYNKVRQAGITQEIAEIVGGAAAV